MTQTTGRTLVLGGTGKTGRRVVERLAARGVATRVGSRAADPPFDWEDRGTWAPALEGVSAAYVSYYPDLAVPGAVETVGTFARVAAEHGVSRLVLLSGRGEQEAQRAERAVQEAGIAWTVVRCSAFNQNFSESFLLEPVLAGELALPVDGVREPFVDAEDIAAVAVAALTEDGHAGRVYELTGPRLMTFAEAVAEIARASGRSIRFASVPVEPWAAELTAMGLPDDDIGLMTYLFTEVFDGRNAVLTDGVQAALGRPARPFGEYAAAAAAAGAWAGPEDAGR